MKMRNFSKFSKFNLKDAIFAGRVISAGIVVAGYGFLSVWLMNYLLRNAWGKLISIAAMIIVAAFGIWQGWLCLKNVAKNNNHDNHVFTKAINRKNSDTREKLMN